MANELDNFDMSAFLSLEEVQKIEDDTSEGKPQEEEIEIQEDTEEVDSTEEDKKDVGEEDSEKDSSEEVADEDDDAGDSDKSKSSSKSPYSSLASALAEEGVLPSFDPEKDNIESVDDLIELFRSEIKNNEYSDLTEEQKQYLQAIRNGVPLEDYNKNVSAVKQLESITSEEIEENETLRREIILQNYLAEGLSKEKAEKLTKRSFDIGEDVADAGEALDSLKEYQKVAVQKQIEDAEKRKQELQKQNEEQLRKLQSTINEQKEIIPGIKLTDKVKEKIFEQATKPVAQLENGQYVNEVAKVRMEDPIGFETKLNYLFYVTKGFSDFSKIATSQKTKAVKDLDDLVKGNTFVPSGKAATKDLEYSPDLDGFDADVINNIK